MTSLIKLEIGLLSKQKEIKEEENGGKRKRGVSREVEWSRINSSQEVSGSVRRWDQNEDRFQISAGRFSWWASVLSVQKTCQTSRAWLSQCLCMTQQCWVMRIFWTLRGKRIVLVCVKTSLCTWCWSLLCWLVSVCDRCSSFFQHKQISVLCWFFFWFSGGHSGAATGAENTEHLWFLVTKSSCIFSGTLHSSTTLMDYF